MDRGRHLLSLDDLAPAEVRRLLDAMRTLKRAGTTPPPTLQGRSVGLLFRRPSTRTRTTFHLAARRLGAEVITYGPEDLQIVTGESLGDTALVLSELLDVLVVRTTRTAELVELGVHGRPAIVNALTEEEHPTQALADLLTIEESRGSLEGTHVVFLGDGGNIVTSLMQAVARTPGMELTVVTPASYPVADDQLRRCVAMAERTGATIRHATSARDVAGRADVVYTTRWRSMGQEKSDPRWREHFAPLRVDRAMLEMLFAEPRRGVFLHDLPAERGAEVTSEVLDGPTSRVRQQAQNKLFAAMATLSRACAEDGGAA